MQCSMQSRQIAIRSGRSSSVERPVATDILRLAIEWGPSFSHDALGVLRWKTDGVLDWNASSVDVFRVISLWHPDYGSHAWGDLLGACGSPPPLKRVWALLRELERNPQCYMSRELKERWSFFEIGGRHFVETGHHRTVVGRYFLELNGANELRNCFGVVPQETILFSGSVYDNLQMANPNATFQPVVQAAGMAEIHHVIEPLPHGYPTEIVERGVGLSGGQKQRVAIARALLKNPKILVFDEATSGPDDLTADQVGRTVSNLRGLVTIIFVGHAPPKSLAVDRTVSIPMLDRPASDASDARSSVQ